MSGSFWRPSKEQRRAILLLEALGVIHDLGKLSSTFLKSQDPSATVEYEHTLLIDSRRITIYKSSAAAPASKAANQIQEWLNNAATKPCAFGERADLTTVLEKIQFTDWSGQTYSFAELILLAAKPSLVIGKDAISPAEWSKVLGKEMQPGLLVGYLHGPAHIEKEGEPDRHKQAYSDVFRATPFGLEERIGTDSSQELTDALNALPLADIEQITTAQRSDWLVKMKAHMSRGLADNRRPHNEVSLWDWGFTVATMTKAAAAWIFKKGWPADLNNLPYRTLCINLDVLERYTHSDKISDLLGTRQALDEAFQEVKKLLEEKYAVGNRFYHDETGAYYLLPDIFNDTELAALRTEIQAQFPPDLRPQVHLGERITAGNIDKDKSLSRKLVAEPRAQAQKEKPVRADNNLYLFETEWAKGRPENAEVCMVCGVQPVGYPRQNSQPEAERELAVWATQKKAEQRNVCRVCLDRRGRRAEEWAKCDLQGTIWTDEVADDNGRLALFVGKLGLEGWLDGTLLSTLQVTSSTTKNPSPARLYRIAETARAFWEQVTYKLTPTIVGQRPFRLALYPKTDNLPDLGDFHAYELEVNGVALSVVWDKPNGRFLTADNLTYFADRCGMKRDEIASRFEGHMFQVLEPSAFLQPGQPLVKTVIKRVERLAGYQPVIPLLSEPNVCLMLVPADKALELARAVKRDYEEQMGRVRDRLPLYLGLVFCHRRTPIRTVLEAGRAMLGMDAGEKWEGWRLIKSNRSDSGKGELIIGEDKWNWLRLIFDKSNIKRELLFDNGITWQVPLLAGDGQTVDEWYPRLHESDALADWLTKKQDKQTKGAEHLKDFKHVKELRVRNPKMPLDRGWKVWVKPSRFDFEFLDATGRRFKIYYDENGRRSRHTRPFYLEDLDRFEELWKRMKWLPVSQRYQVIHTIEATRETWHGADGDGQSTGDKVFEQFVTDTLAQAEWPKDKSWSKMTDDERQSLIKAGVQGELADLAELHMEILKE